MLKPLRLSVKGEPVLSVRALSRRFGDTLALDDVTFDVAPGRLTGFVGGNGAGKTTTMRIVMGVLAPTSGDVVWDGVPLSEQTRRSFGYMPEERGLYPRMKITDQLVFFAQLHGLASTDARTRAGELLERLGLAERSGDVLQTLSLGNQQRVQIAAALIHRPTALVLDEPFSGLDPMAVDSMTSLLKEVEATVPVLFSSHQLDLVERVCDDLVILDQGRIAAAGSPDELRLRGPNRWPCCSVSSPRRCCRPCWAGAPIRTTSASSRRQGSRCPRPRSRICEPGPARTTS
jgi:ABC-2 type transport system ATP-binding protein